MPEKPLDSPSNFAQQVRDALSYLHDPGHLQSHPLTRFLRGDASSRPSSLGRALHQALLDAVESLRPSADIPASRHASRAYLILKLRYLDALDIPRVQDRLAISKTVYYVEQQRALEAVTSLLLEKWGQGGLDVTLPRGREARPAGWHRSEELAGRRADRTNLPAQLTSFVGREREMAEVRRLLGTTRLLTLTGSGGCGKTRLAYQTAADVLDDYADGVWVVELAALAEPELVPQAVASAIGAREVAGQPVLAALIGYLSTRRLLLVIDNCEHLIDASAQLVEAILTACPEVRVLATSRETLAIAGETVWRVSSLSLADPELATPVEVLAQSEAVRLFVDRALAVEPTFAVTSGNSAAIARICWRLDGVPLAIELAAARLTATSVEQIAERLGDRFRLLTGGSRTALHRQQTLRATMDWSHDLLAEPERVLLRRLAVFSGGWTLEAAESVGVGDGIVAEEVMDLLAGLVRKSLASIDKLGEQTRYRLLETIRQYAGEKLANSGEADAARARHRDWCLALGGRAESAWYGRDQLLWLARLEVEQDNLRSALRWYLKGDADAGLQLMASVWQLWDFRGQWSEGVKWLEAFLERAPARTRARAKALHALASIARTMNWITEAIQPLAEESVSVALEVGDNSTAGWALKDLGCTFILEGKYSQATAALEESITAFRAAQNMPGVGASLRNLATTVSHLGDHATAEAHLEESLALLREVGDSWSLALTLRQLGDLTRLLGDYPKARRLFDESLDLFQRIASRDRVAQVLCDLSSLARVRGDYGEAERLLGEVEALIRDHPGWAPLARIFHEAYGELYGALAVAKGSFVRGARLLGAADRHGSWIHFYPAHAADRSAALAAARQALGEEAFTRAWAEGRAMTLEQAVEYALEDEEQA